MSFNNLNKNKKRELLNMSIKSNEHLLYESLIKLGIDPVIFDLETFDTSNLPSEDVSKELIENLKKAISSLKTINSELSLLEQ
jgi:hypothetical protein